MHATLLLGRQAQETQYPSQEAILAPPKSSHVVPHGRAVCGASVLIEIFVFN